MIPMVIKSVRSLPPADDRAVGAEDVVVLQQNAVVNGQHFAKGSANVAGVAAAFIGPIPQACPTPGVMVVLVAVGGAALCNAERQVPPVVRRSRDAVARANRSDIAVAVPSVYLRTGFPEGGVYSVFAYPGQPVRTRGVGVAVGVCRAGVRPARQARQVPVLIIANTANVIITGDVTPDRAVPPVEVFDIYPANPRCHRFFFADSKLIFQVLLS